MAHKRRPLLNLETSDEDDLSLKAWHIENLIDSEPDAQVVILAEAQEVVDNLVEKNKALEAKLEAH